MRIRLKLSAGASRRDETPVEWTLPDRLARARELALVRVDTGRAVDAVRDPDRALLRFVLDEPLAAGVEREYELLVGGDARGVHGDGERVEASWDGADVLFRVGGRRALAYRFATVEAPAGAGSHHDRSGYLHPLWTPGGVPVTNDFPKNHVHHHGVWFPWKYVELGGRKANFWETGAKEGRIEAVRLERFASDPVSGALRATQRFVDLNAPGGPRTALEETWQLRVWSVRGGTLFDLDVEQRCPRDSMFRVLKNHYGGLGFRGHDDWEGAEGCRFLTSEGKTRADGHATRASWCAIEGEIGGRLAGILIACHPENLRAPQNMRIHPTEPFFNFAPCQLGDFEIRPDAPLRSRYRFFVHDGPTSASRAEEIHRDWVEPPGLELV